MQRVQLALQTAIFVVLCIIAFELSRLARDFQLVGDVSAALTTTKPTRPETPEERKARIHREAQHMSDFTDDEAAVLSESFAIDAKKRAAHRPQTRPKAPQ